MDQDLLYFAYGSNINESDLRLWCDQAGYPYPLSRKYANAYLPDTQPVFNYQSQRRKGGALNIRHRLGQVTPGVLYQVTPEELDILDQKEGSPNVYKHLDVLALTEDGHEHVAVTYQVHSSMTEGGFVPPHREYLQVLKDGIAHHGFDTGILDAVAQGNNPPWYIERLFVYGTLMEGGPRHHILKSWGKIEQKVPAKTRGILYDTGKAFPCMTPADNEDQQVFGEIYPLKDIKKAFEMLDIVESVKRYGEYGSFFRRAIIRASVDDGSSCLSWCYLSDMDIRSMSVIASGQWPLPS